MYFPSLQGYFRRAEALKLVAVEMKTDTKEDREAIAKYLLSSVRDYIVCYEKMTDPKELPSRIKQYAEAMKMSIPLSQLNENMWHLHVYSKSMCIVHL